MRDDGSIARFGFCFGLGDGTRELAVGPGRRCLIKILSPTMGWPARLHKGLSLFMGESIRPHYEDAADVTLCHGPAAFNIVVLLRVILSLSLRRRPTCPMQCCEAMRAACSITAFSSSGPISARWGTAAFTTSRATLTANGPSSVNSLRRRSTANGTSARAPSKEPPHSC